MQEKKIIKLLEDFKQEKEEKLKSGLFTNFHKFSINEGDYDEKRLIRYIFKKFLNFVIWDKPIEKVNWEIPFKYKNINASFTHQKFGFRLYIENKVTQDKAEGLFNEIIGKINIILKLIEPIVRNEGIKSLVKGEVIIENKLRELEEEFNFFLNEAQIKRKKSNIPNTLKLSDRTVNVSFKLYKEAEFLSNATYISFFSLLEHLCILGLAFTNTPEKFNFEDFSRKKWQEKFKIVFPLNVPEFRDYYNKFIDLAKYRRNPTAHGHLDKAYTIFNFYLPEASHRIPMGLYNRELVHSLKKEDNLTLLKSFIKLIRTNKTTKRWMLYLDRGFDVYYEKGELGEYMHFMKSSSRDVKEYLEYLSRMEDDLGNMDW